MKKVLMLSVVICLVLSSVCIAETLSKHKLFATGTTGTTGKVVTENCDLEIQRLKSGPLGGDQQLGARIANEALDVLIFELLKLCPLQGGCSGIK